MAKLKFRTSTEAFNRLITGELEAYYKVPQYQRNYCWETEHWEDLWNDLIEAQTQTPQVAHYMGYLVFHDGQHQEEEGIPETNPKKTAVIKRKDIVDGQQRLASVSLLFLAGARLITDLGGAEQQVKRLKENYLQFFTNKDMNTPKLRIKLNKIDGEIFARLVDQVQIQDVSTQLSLKSKRKKELSQIEKGYLYFYEKLKAYFNRFEDPVSDILDFLDFAGNNLMFSVMEAEDEAEIFNLFETLNSRGLALSAVDLLKNHLIKVVNTEHKSDEDLIDMIATWSTLQEKISDETNKEQGKHLLDFIQTYWGAIGEEKQTKKLYKSFKNKIQTYEDVATFLKKLQDVADCYLALFNEKNHFWDSYPKIDVYIKDTLIFKYKQHKSILLAAYLYLNPQCFDTVCRGLVVCMVRYLTFCDKNPNQLESSFKSLISWFIDCSTGKRSFSRDAYIEQLKKNQLYPSNEDVRMSLGNRLFKQNAVPRYLLLRSFYSNESALTYEQSELFTLEHILPKSKKESDEWIYQLGNLTLLSKNDNNSLGSKPFDKRLLVLQKNAFEFDQRYFKEFTPESLWDEQAIEARTQHIISAILTRWSL